MLASCGRECNRQDDESQNGFDQREPDWDFNNPVFKLIIVCPALFLASFLPRHSHLFYFPQVFSIAAVVYCNFRICRYSLTFLAKLYLYIY